MRLIPQKPATSSEEPFEGDLLDRQPFAESLLNLISRVDDNLVIALDAEWGEGKTVFVEMWRNFLIKKKVKSIYFDAFANDYIDNPFIALTSELSSFFDQEASSNDEVKESLNAFKEHAKKAGVKFLGIGTKIAIKALTAGFVSGKELGDLKDAILDTSSDIIEDVVASKIKTYKEDREILNTFRAQLESLACVIKDDTKRPLIFIIDELDRCKPPYALDFIEKVKHFFSVPNIIFVLVLNKHQLESSVKSIYGNEIEPNLYLQKFINIECMLPKNRDIDSGTINKYCDALLSMHEIDNHHFKKYIINLNLIFNLSLRELERVFSYITLYGATLYKNEDYDPNLISFLAIIKVRKPDIFTLLRVGELSYEGLKEKLKIANLDGLIEKEQIYSWLFGLMDFFLSSDDAVKNIKDFETHNRSYLGSLPSLTSRRVILQNICSKFEAFQFTDVR